MFTVYGSYVFKFPFEPGLCFDQFAYTFLNPQTIAPLPTSPYNAIQSSHNCIQGNDNTKQKVLISFYLSSYFRFLFVALVFLETSLY